MSSYMQRRPAVDGASRKSAVAAGTDKDSRQLDILAAIDTADEGRRRRDDGMRTAEHTSDVRVRAALETVIRDLAATGQEFTADQVRQQVDPASPQLLGAAFSRAARDGIIVCVGATTSASPSRHGGLLRVWRGVS